MSNLIFRIDTLQVHINNKIALDHYFVVSIKNGVKFHHGSQKLVKSAILYIFYINIYKNKLLYHSSYYVQTKLTATQNVIK